jgi:hypothetical protein
MKHKPHDGFIPLTSKLVSSNYKFDANCEND